MDLSEVRQTVASAITAEAGTTCQPYPPDVLTPPALWVDTISLAPTEPVSFCLDGIGVTVVAVTLRNDTRTSLSQLERLIPAVGKAAKNSGCRVLSINSGSVDIGGQSLPGITWNISAFISGAQ